MANTNKTKRSKITTRDVPACGNGKFCIYGDSLRRGCRSKNSEQCAQCKQLLDSAKTEHEKSYRACALGNFWICSPACQKLHDSVHHPELSTQQVAGTSAAGGQQAGQHQQQLVEQLQAQVLHLEAQLFQNQISQEQSSVQAELHLVAEQGGAARFNQLPSQVSGDQEPRRKTRASLQSNQPDAYHTPLTALHEPRPHAASQMLLQFSILPQYRNCLGHNQKLYDDALSVLQAEFNDKATVASAATNSIECQRYRSCRMAVVLLNGKVVCAAVLAVLPYQTSPSPQLQALLVLYIATKRRDKLLQYKRKGFAALLVSCIKEVAHKQTHKVVYASVMKSDGPLGFWSKGCSFQRVLSKGACNRQLTLQAPAQDYLQCTELWACTDLASAASTVEQRVAATLEKLQTLCDWPQQVAVLE